MREGEGGYSADSLTILEGLDAVRYRPEMYVGRLGRRGLIGELTASAMFLGLNRAWSGADRVSVTLEEDDSVTCSSGPPRRAGSPFASGPTSRCCGCRASKRARSPTGRGARPGSPPASPCASAAPAADRAQSTALRASPSRAGPVPGARGGPRCAFYRVAVPQSAIAAQTTSPKIRSRPRRRRLSAGVTPPALTADPIRALLAGLPPDVEVQAQVGGLWIAAGRGRLTSPAPRSLEFRGSLGAVVPGEVAFRLELTGEETARFEAGSERDDGARWWPFGGGIGVSARLADGPGEAAFVPGDGGLYLEVAGPLNALLWLGPAE